MNNINKVHALIGTDSLVLVGWEACYLQVNLYIYNIILKDDKYHEENQAGLKMREGYFILCIQVSFLWDNILADA